ncbi:MAG: hypothetical protein PHI44_00780, partial [Candidatus Ratteibacteria bacterium]|nr:hypothetical protein [Candidatus Ratteibacteria bacterium]
MKRRILPQFLPIKEWVRGGLVRGGVPFNSSPYEGGGYRWGWLEGIFRFSVLDLEFIYRWGW